MQQQISSKRLLDLYNLVKKRPEFEYFQHTIDFLFMKLGLRYLSLKLYEDALFLAFSLNSEPLLNYIHIMSHKQRNIIVETLVDHYKEK